MNLPANTAIQNEFLQAMIRMLLYHSAFEKILTGTLHKINEKYKTGLDWERANMLPGSVFVLK